MDTRPCVAKSQATPRTRGISTRQSDVNARATSEGQIVLLAPRADTRVSSFCSMSCKEGLAGDEVSAELALLLSMQQFEIGEVDAECVMERIGESAWLLREIF